MTTTHLPQTACQFCSEVSKANGEDPIGSAYLYHHWVIVEIAQPWLDNYWSEHPIIAPIFELAKNLSQTHRVSTRPLMIAPDPKYSQPGLIRVLYYRRPDLLFAQFEKQEFILPEAEVVSLVTTLLQHPEQLSRFTPYQQETSSVRELLVCTHGNVDVACSRFGYPIYKQLRQNYASDNLRVWRCSHFGGHNFAPTLIDLPNGQYWGHLEPEILELLIYHQGNVDGLRHYYRGWCGLSRFAQIVEREIWMQRGWDWLTYLKSGEIMAIDPANEEYYADWAEIRINFKAPDDRIPGVYEARVEACGSVVTQWQSGESKTLKEAKQYRVASLERIS